jgi:preprotein translocase subunit SecF
VAAVKQALGSGIEYRRTELVGPKVSDELFWNGLYAMISAILAILVYIWFRFEWQFGLCAVMALTHDVVSTIGVFSLIQHEFNLATVAAVLTIAGYSINDTVVVFDRVRENLRKYKTMPLDELLNKSNNETLSRTMMTSFTTLLALFALYAFGGEIIRDFAFAMIWGIVVGTYSSVFVAVPLLLWMGLNRNSRVDEDADNGTIEQTS